MVTALGALVVVIVAASVFAATARFGGLWRAVAPTRGRLAAAATFSAAVAIAWALLSPLAAASLVPLFAAGAAARSALRRGELADYAAASDLAHSADPPWWDEFERDFRRECRRRERARGRPAR